MDASEEPAKRPRRDAAPVSFVNEGRAGRAGRVTMVEDGALERLAERIVTGELGSIGHTIRLPENTSWKRLLGASGMGELGYRSLTRAAEDIVERAVELYVFTIRSRKKNIDEDEIDRLQNENTRALPPHPTPPPFPPRASSPPPHPTNPSRLLPPSPHPPPRLPCQHH